MRQILFLGLIILAFLTGCKKDDESTEPGSLGGFQPIDLSLGKSWTYNYYGSMVSDSGATLYTLTDTFFVKIASVNDSLKGYKNLIRYEAQSLSNFSGIEKVWYKLDGDSLVEIAYLNAGVGIVLPKVVKTVSKEFKKRPSFFSKFPKGIQILMKTKGFEDSVLFRDDIRVVYKFPLVRGKKWTSFTYPFFQTREVVENGFMNFSGRNLFYANIHTAIPEFGPDLSWNDYVSEQGLIKRNIIINSLRYTTSESPEGLGYYRWEEILELIN